MSIGAMSAIIIAAIALVGLVVGLVVTLFYREKSRELNRIATGSAEAWKNERDAERAHRMRLEAQLEKAQQKIVVLEAKVSELENRPNLQSIERALERHEERAEARAEKMITALDSIVVKLTEET